MEKTEGHHLGKIFVSVFLVSSLLVGATFAFAGFEIALLVALCWLTSVVATTAVGIENTINQK
jgi:hypothetical protein